jgi:hypothetical protein
MALTPKSATIAFTSNPAKTGSGQFVTAFGSSFVTTDATASPQVSPITVSSTAINFVVPANAIQMVISNNANALRISEVSTVTGNYYVLPASTTNFFIDCSRMTNIYMIRDSADVTVQFMFVLL